jgi:lysozyme
MTPSADLIQFVSGWESCQLTPYLDPVGLPTIGYGHRLPPGASRDPITQDEAATILATDLSATMRGLSMAVSADWSQQQADALCDLAFNCGVHAIANSHLMALFNTGDDAGALAQFLVWDHAGGGVSSGLLKRRLAEQAIFTRGDYSGRP